MKLKQLSTQHCGDWLEVHVILRNGRKARVIVPPSRTGVFDEEVFMCSAERPDFWEFCTEPQLRSLARLAVESFYDAEHGEEASSAAAPPAETRPR